MLSKRNVRGANVRGREKGKGGHDGRIMERENLVGSIDGGRILRLKEKKYLFSIYLFLRKSSLMTNI